MQQLTNQLSKLTLKSPFERQTRAVYGEIATYLEKPFSYLATCRSVCHPDVYKRILSLQLDGSDITDEYMRKMATRFTNLRTLQLKMCNEVTDKGIGHLAQLKLQVVSLEYCSSLTDACLPFLARIPTLHSLKLTYLPVTFSAKLCPFKDHPNLQNLTCITGHVTQDGIASIGQIQSLRRLILGGVHCNNHAVIKCVAGLPKIQFLKISGMYLTGDILPTIFKKASLKRFDFHCYTQLTSNQFSNAPFSNIEQLTIINKVHLEWISKLPKLHKLVLSNFGEVPARVLRWFVKHPALKVLQLENKSQLSNQGEEFLKDKKVTVHKKENSTLIVKT